MEGWVLHLHIIAAISWIGGSVFMFALGVTLRDKKIQKQVYPHVGPIFGWFEVGALLVLLATGIMLGVNYSLFSQLFVDGSLAISDEVNYCDNSQDNNQYKFFSYCIRYSKRAIHKQL